MHSLIFPLSGCVTEASDLMSLVSGFFGRGEVITLEVDISTKGTLLQLPAWLSSQVIAHTHWRHDICLHQLPKLGNGYLTRVGRRKSSRHEAHENLNCALLGKHAIFCQQVTLQEG